MPRPLCETSYVPGEKGSHSLATPAAFGGAETWLFGWISNPAIARDNPDVDDSLPPSLLLRGAEVLSALV